MAVTPLPRPKLVSSVDREETRTFTSWKLDLLAAMLSDRRVRDKHFRIAARVLEAVNQKTRLAIIGDAVLIDEVPGTDRFQCNDARKHLEDLDYWTVERGHGGKASRYRFFDVNVDRIFDQRTLARDKRNEESERRKRMVRRRKP
jgi:hypothetical protein